MPKKEVARRGQSLGEYDISVCPTAPLCRLNDRLNDRLNGCLDTGLDYESIVG